MYKVGQQGSQELGSRKLSAILVDIKQIGGYHWRWGVLASLLRRGRRRRGQVGPRLDRGDSEQQVAAVWIWSHAELGHQLLRLIWVYVHFRPVWRHIVGTHGRCGAHTPHNHFPVADEYEKQTSVDAVTPGIGSGSEQSLQAKTRHAVSSQIAQPGAYARLLRGREPGRRVAAEQGESTPSIARR